MRILKFLSMLVLILGLVSCKANPANEINKQLKQIQTTNNQIINQINTINAHEGEFQAAFETDLNTEGISLETSELNTLLSIQKEEATQLGNYIESFKKEVEGLDKINVEGLDKGLQQFNTIKSNLQQQITQFETVTTKLASQFESQSELINITIDEEPSIQDLQDSLLNFNNHSKDFYSLLNDLKTNNDEFLSSIEKWNSALNDETVADEPEDNDDLVINEPTEIEPPIVEVEEIKYVIDQNFYVRSLEETEKPLVLLTFDDCVQPEPNSYTLNIAKTLQEKGVNAIFFFNGMFLESQYAQNVLKEVYEMGFAIGNHTYSHPYLNQLDYEQTRAEIVETNDIIESIIGVRPKLFRPSFGIMGSYGEQVVQEEGMLWMNWTYGYDWEPEYLEAGPLADIMVNTPYLTDGANLLMHDRKWTAEATGQIIDGLIEKGYEIIDPNLLQVPGDN